MKTKSVTLKKIQNSTQSDISDFFYKFCCFCEKTIEIQPINNKTCKNLSGKNKTFCPSCLRGNRHYRSSKNILCLSFRGIIAYYYYCFYKQKPQKMYFNQLQDIIHEHQYIGLQNPVLDYDREIFMWYADFNKIGNDPKKGCFLELKQTIKHIINSFEVTKMIKENADVFLFQKFEKSLNLFYQQRQRPQNRKFLIPTLKGLADKQNNFFEQTRIFVEDFFVL